MSIREALGAQRLAGEVARHRHRYAWDSLAPSDPSIPGHSEWRCVTCGALKDPQATHKGRSASRLGKDQERRIERVYGPQKVGEFGDAIDLIGRVWKWQAKSTRNDPPHWLDGLGEWGPIEARSWMTEPLEHMEPLRRDLRPLLIKTWVHTGKRPIDIIIVRCTDWAEEHGGPEPMGELMAMTGGYFLDVNGRDER